MSLAAQSRLNGTVNFNYFPIIVTGNTAAIYPHLKLGYDHYFVTMEPGVITDTSGAPFAAFQTRINGPSRPKLRARSGTNA